ncbi:hypothetical protein RFN28_09465 [Mesorhizobium sp. VK24D]|uniref:Uncharacterized protein n=1 Tax=Mesorhizobium album TaxID=3072314 RepID=A0ABU4XVI8_9HYPH|nr:hypothetical protein [Mesorhizobium sp. VK24D]MDX8478709.1 hypothetical protein [Mesorhizobium sp. VK24D]
MSLNSVSALSGPLKACFPNANSGNTPRLAVLPEQIAEEAEAASCAPENVFSLVKRTLFEAYSKACRLGKASLTSVLTWRLLLARPLSVNPGTANIAPDPELGSHAENARNFIAPFFKREEESDRLSAVFPAGFVQKGLYERQHSPLPEESARERQ